MGSSSKPVDAKLVIAANYIKTGLRKEAGQILREVLVADEHNLTAWELLLGITETTDEEVYCLNHILMLRPSHPWARQRLATISSTGPYIVNLPPSPAASLKRHSSFGPTRPTGSHLQRQATLLPIAMAVFSLICVGILGITLGRTGLLAGAFPASQTGTADASLDSGCQDLIQKAMLESGDYCNNMGPNQVCYGNITLQADLQPNTRQRFSERGDTIDVSLLRRLYAAPLDPTKNQWGIAVFKVLANLPRSLPGQLVTMMVFGNTTIEKPDQGLESFYFSTDFGKVMCEEVPFDGILVNIPEGAGVSFTVNGTNLTLMGDAKLNAARNGNMEISLYRGAARVVSNGQQQYFGAGSSVKVRLGGANGNNAIGAPSVPVPLSPSDINLSCALASQNCASTDIQPLSVDQAKTTVMTGLELANADSPTPVFPVTGITSTAADTQTAIPTAGAPTDTLKLTKTPKATKTPEPTQPTETPKPTGTPKPTKTPKPTQPTNTPKPSNTPKPTQPTNTPKPSNTPKPTQPTNTPKPSSTSKPTQPTNTPKPSSTSKPTQPTNTPKPSNTPKPTKTPKDPTPTNIPAPTDTSQLPPSNTQVPVATPGPVATQLPTDTTPPASP